MFDDLARESGLRVVRAAGAITDLAGELGTRCGRRPSLLFDGDHRPVRAAMMLRLGLGHVAKTRTFRALPGAVATRTSRGQPKGIADPAVTPANPAIFRGHRKRPFLERSEIV